MKFVFILVVIAWIALLGLWVRQMKEMIIEAKIKADEDWEAHQYHGSVHTDCPHCLDKIMEDKKED